MTDTAWLAGPPLRQSSGVWLDDATHEVWVDGQRLDPPLSPAQLALLALLYHSAGQVVAHARIIAAVWPGINPTSVGGVAVDALTKRLSVRLREVRSDHDYIEVLRGHG